MSNIDKNVPIPTINAKHPSILKLEVGDSFSFDITKRATIQSMASVVKKKTGRNFTVKKIDEDSGRIWRVQ